MLLLTKIKPTEGHPFLSNKYTCWYYSIIENARNRKIEPDYIERHHIIPKSFYVNQSVSGWITGNPNLASNIINLSAREHFLCHWLLTKMITGPAYYMMEQALAMFGRRNCLQHRIISSGQYAKIKKSYSLAKKHTYWFNNGVIECMSSECPSGWTAGRLPRAKGLNKWYNNGDDQIMSKICPTNWQSGMLTGNDRGVFGRKWCNNGIEQKRLKDCPPGWELGQLGHSTAGLKRFTNGTDNCTSIECPPGWWPGISNKGRNWYNNGIEQKRLKDCPVGWVPGQLTGGSIGMKWYNNGIISKLLKDCPPGWTAGRVNYSRKHS
jgi:hypothetical protein